MGRLVGIIILLAVFGWLFYMVASLTGVKVALGIWGSALLMTILVVIGVSLTVK